MSDGTVSNKCAGCCCFWRHRVRVVVAAAVAAIAIASRLQLHRVVGVAADAAAVIASQLLLLYLGVYGTARRTTAGSGHRESSNVWHREMKHNYV